VEPDTGAHQVLPQIATLIGIDLAARVSEIVVFDKSGELRGPIIICACDHLPRKVRMICPPASVDWDTTGYGVLDLNTCRFGIVNADAAAGIRLKSLVSRCESQYEVRHERAGIDPGCHVGLASRKLRGTARAGRERLVQGEISPTPEAIIKEIAFNGRPNYPCTKDVTEFDATKETNVIFRVHMEIRSEKWRIWIIVRKISRPAPVLIDISPRVDRAVKAESIHWWRRRSNLLVDLLPGLHRSGDKSE